MPYICAFAPRVPGARDGPRVWNDQLVRFACYERSDETLLGDPANKAFTDFAIRALGWKPPARRTAFDVLPLVLQAGPGEDPALYELPPWYVSRISIKHNDAPWLRDMGVKWNAVLLEASTELMLGGLIYTAVPYSGWCALPSRPWCGVVRSCSRDLHSMRCAAVQLLRLGRRARAHGPGALQPVQAHCGRHGPRHALGRDALEGQGHAPRQ